ncbi:MAG: glutamine--fructose-6-phosphate transaminase (isomerizing), partial [Acidobacteriota bacterium]
MCGIFGIIFDKHRDDLGKILLKAGRMLTYRGYDSAGMAVFSSSSIKLEKDVGKIEEINRRFRFDTFSGYKGIIQLRWATFGAPSKANSQPHFDCSKHLVGAHNGNIVNTKELIQAFTQKGHNFRGENDGEVIVHVVEDCLKQTGDISSAIRLAADILKGDYAYVITAEESDRMYCVKKYSSLYLGIGEEFICCSSDLHSIIPLTRRVVSIYDGEYIEFGARDYTIRKLVTGETVQRTPHKVDLNIEQAKKDPYPHFMLKEIYEQPMKSQALIQFLRESGQVSIFLEGLKKSLSQSSDSSSLFLIGSGTSYNASVLGAYYLNKIAGIGAVPVIAGAFKESFGGSDLSRSSYILVSQSGETKDVINVVNFLEEKSASNIFALVNVLGSSLQLRVKNYLPLLSDIEISVPATKTFTNQVLIFLYLAMNLTESNLVEAANLKEEFCRFPEMVRQTLDQTDKACRRISSILSRRPYLYYLGYGINYGACLEGALKMKEITYIPCEGMYSSEFKHGPLAIINQDDWVIFLATRENVHMTVSHINEISCRGGKILTIAPSENSLEDNSDEFISLSNENYYFAPLL